MTTRIINDPESIERQRKLLFWLESSASELAVLAGGELMHGHGDYAMQIRSVVQRHRDIAVKIRERLVNISELTLADVQAEQPPMHSVGLVGWLRERVGRWFPWVRTEEWQLIATVLLARAPWTPS